MRQQLPAAQATRELAELCRTSTESDGLLVRGRCYEVRARRGARYEIVVDGFGSCAVVDVAQRGDVPGRMIEAMDAFARAQRLRGVAPLPTR